MGVGDHLVVNRGGYTHHGVDLGDGTVIHFNGEPATKIDATIRRSSRWQFSLGNAVSICARPTDPRPAVERAKASQGINGYNLLGSNCEHFASWAVSGVATSAQVRELAREAHAALGRSVLSASPAPLLGWAFWEFGQRLWRTLRAQADAHQFTAQYAAVWQGDSWQAADGRIYAFVRPLDWITPTPNGLARVQSPGTGTLGFRLWMDPLTTVFSSSPDGRFFLVGDDGPVAMSPQETPVALGAPIPTLLRRPPTLRLIEQSGLPAQQRWTWVD